MAGSTWGTLLTMTTWGESHGKGVGVVVDGCPAGLALCEEDIQTYLNRRKPGQSRFTTMRQESDQVEILSGVFEGKTTGTPISLLVRNTDQRSHDYSSIMDIYRPGHADYTFDEKYGFRDYRGGGRSSGRETIGRVAAGAIAAKLLESLGVTVTAYARSIGPVEISMDRFDLEAASENKVCMPDREAAKEAESYLEQMLEDQDSVGGVVECITAGSYLMRVEIIGHRFGSPLGACIVGQCQMFPVSRYFIFRDRCLRNGSVTFGHNERPSVGIPADAAYMSHHDGVGVFIAAYVHGETSL